MYRIGVFSKMSKTTVKALRYYDEIGILKPEVTDKFTGYRMYTTDQLFKLHYIQSLRQIGLSIDEINLILKSGSTEMILENRRVEVVTQLKLAHEILSRIDFILSEKGDENFMSYQAIIKDLPKCIVYSQKMVIPGYEVYNEVIPAIGKKLTDKYPDLKCVVPEYCFVRYLDGEYREQDINIEFCEAVDKMKPDFDGIVFKELESVKAVSVMHKGSYSTISQAYAFVYKWIEGNEYSASDSPRESYIDGVWNKDSEEEWLTEIQIPIIKSSSIKL